jgi:hypothetical protein
MLSRLFLYLLFCLFAPHLSWSASDSNYVTIEFNDFDSSFGNWKFIHFGTKGDFVYDSLKNGWARIYSSNGDFYPENSGCGLYYQAPAGGYWTFYCSMRSQTYDAPHHGGGKFLQVRENLTDNSDYSMIGLAEGGKYALIANQWNLLATGQIAPASPQYVKVTCEKSTCTFYLSSDSTNWTILGQPLSGRFYRYIVLADNYMDGWTEYGFAKVMAPPTAAAAPRLTRFVVTHPAAALPVFDFRGRVVSSLKADRAVFLPAAGAAVLATKDGRLIINNK